MSFANSRSEEIFTENFEKLGFEEVETLEKENLTLKNQLLETEEVFEKVNFESPNI